MTGNFILPPTGFGPGSQPDPEGGAELEYMPLPQDMRTYSPHVPETAAPEVHGPALTLLDDISEACRHCAETGRTREFDLAGLDPANRALIAVTLGTGEVSLKILGIPAIAVQEAVFAGVWQARGAGIDRVEVAPVPTRALARAFTPKVTAAGLLAPKPAGLASAPALAVELFDRSAAWTPQTELHVVNLTLLPHSEPDLAWLDTVLGTGAVTILSRGYGNCRITATATPHVWRVQFFNSMDTLILDTFEVTAMPEVALAAPEDLADSAERIREVLEAIQ